MGSPVKIRCNHLRLTCASSRYLLIEFLQISGVRLYDGESVMRLTLCSHKYKEFHLKNVCVTTFSWTHTVPPLCASIDCFPWVFLKLRIQLTQHPQSRKPDDVHTCACCCMPSKHCSDHGIQLLTTPSMWWQKTWTPSTMLADKQVLLDSVWVQSIFTYPWKTWVWLWLPVFLGVSSLRCQLCFAVTIYGMKCSSNILISRCG